MGLRVEGLGSRVFGSKLSVNIAVTANAARILIDFSQSDCALLDLGCFLEWLLGYP